MLVRPATHHISRLCQKACDLSGISVIILVTSCIQTPNGNVEVKKAGARDSLSITSISPPAGAPSGGTSITITGTGFTNSTAVKLGDLPCGSVVLVNESQITCMTPPQGAGSVPVTVYNNKAITATKADGFAYYPEPTITSVSPIGGPLLGGTIVTITGTGFLDGASVTFGDGSCKDAKVLSATQLTCTSPSHAAGAVTVKVTNRTQQSAILQQGFIYSLPPTITAAATPANGTTTGGTLITITGTGFLTGITAQVDNVACTSPLLVSSTQMTCLTPSRASTGNVSISVINGDSQKASRNSSFTYITPVITISTQPANQTASNGNATFSVTASLNGNGSLIYQWQREIFSGAGFKNISGANSSTLTLTNLRNHTNGFRYRAVVSFTGATTVESSAATLTVPYNALRRLEAPSGGARDSTAFITNGVFKGGLVVDANGNLIIASHNYLRKITPEGDELWRIGGNGSSDGQFIDAEGITVASDGKIYVSDQGNHRVQVFSSSGVFQGKFGTSGTGNGQFNKPAGIAIAINGDIYVVDTGNNRVQRFNSSLTYETSFGSPAGAASASDGEFNSPMGLAMDSAGKLYVADRNNHRIQVFSSTGVFVSKFGTSGANDGQLNSPQGVTIDADGRILVSDSGNQRVQIFSSSGIYSAKFGAAGTGVGTFDTPDWITTDGSKNIYVVNDYGVRLGIQVFQSDGTFGTIIGTTKGQTGELFYPYGIAINSSGKIYITDTHNHAVQIFNGDGSFNLKIGGTAGTTNGAFDLPVGNVALTSTGTFYVADTSNDRIQLFTAAGLYNSKVATGAGTGPRGVAADGATKFFVSEGLTHRVRQLDMSGTEFLTVGSFGTLDAQFRWPLGTALSTSGGPIVADLGNARIQVFDTNGNLTLKFGSGGSQDGQFNWPMNPAIDSSGNYYVADHQNHRVQVFNSDGTFKYKFGTQGYRAGEFLYPTAVAIDSSGKIFVMDAGNHRIQKFTCTNSSGAWSCSNEY